MRLLAAMASADLVLASYTALEQEGASSSARSKRNSLLKRIFWHRVVLDEVQMVEGKAGDGTGAAGGGG
jgi:hypothetical protein